MPSPKAKTRGFLFADLRGYSAFAEDRGDRAAADLIGRFRLLVREQIAAHDGAEIRTEGDSFYVVFDSVSDAVRGGLAIRDAATAASSGSDAPIRVGIGIHAGEVEDNVDGIVSSAVNIAARVCSVAEPGEVLVTDTVRGLTRSYLPLTYVARGHRRLKGIRESIAIFRVEATPSRRPGPTPAARGRALALVLAGLIVLAVFVAGLVGGRQPAGGPASPSASTVAMRSLESAGVSTYPAPSTSDTFPDAEEKALLDRLPDSIARTCDRATEADAPVYQRTISNTGRASQFMDVPLGIYGGLTCLVERNRVIYWRSIGSGNIDAVFTRQIVKLNIPSGTCADTDGRAWESWEAGVHTGKVMCYLRSDGTAVLEWTFEDEPLYAVATRRDGDAATLFAWWREDGRLLGR